MLRLYPYEEQIVEAEDMGIRVREVSMRGRFNGLYVNGLIAIEDKLSYVEKNCTMAEEIGHAVENVGDITDQRVLANRKQEQRGRAYGYRKLISLHHIIEAYKAGCANRYEAAEYLDVPERYFAEAINYYYKKYGLRAVVDDYIIFFNEGSSVRVRRKRHS